MSEAIPPIFRHFGPSGVIADLAGLHEDVKLFWQLPLRYLNDAMTPARRSKSRPDEEFSSYLAYLCKPGFNATIRHEESGAAVGVHVGLPLIAHRACRLFALRMDPSTGLPLCDERDRLVVHDERIALPTEWAGFTEPAARASADLLRFEEETDLTNNELATFMFDIAMRYVAMHECLHFALGHARYCQATLGCDTYQDGTERRGALDPITSQTLEFIADRHAIAGLVEDLDGGRLFHEWSRHTPDFVTVSPDVWRRRLLVVTMTLISRLWTAQGAANFGDVSNAYPHPYERACWMVCGLSEMAGNRVMSREFDLSLALSVCSLDRNFQSPRCDVPLIERDNDLHTLIGQSDVDRGYDVVRARAMEIQRKLYRQFGPYYPGVE